MSADGEPAADRLPRRAQHPRPRGALPRAAGRAVAAAGLVGERRDPLVYVTYGSVPAPPAGFPGALPRDRRRARHPARPGAVYRRAPARPRPARRGARQRPGRALNPAGARDAARRRDGRPRRLRHDAHRARGGRPVGRDPPFADQPRNAQRVAALGAGIALDSLDGLTDALHAVLENPAYRIAARAVAADIATLPAVDEAPRIWQEHRLAA